jgi:hypothetical protein
MRPVCPWVRSSQTTIARVGEELGRIYRRMRHGTIDTLDGWRIAQVLMAKAECIELETLQGRVGAGEIVVQVARYSPPALEPINVSSTDIIDAEAEIEPVENTRRKPLLTH